MSNFGFWYLETQIPELRPDLGFPIIGVYNV